MKKSRKKPKKQSKGSRYVVKWLTLLVVFLIIGGVFAFGFIAFVANWITGNAKDYDPVWMVGMVPLMGVLAAPVTYIINKQINKHHDVLTENIKAVADGKTDVYIPVPDTGAFTEVYENFNKMTAEIRSIQTLRTEMIDSFSHELKTPVASIDGFATLLLDEDLSSEKRKSYLGIIKKESAKLSVLAQNTLLLSKIDAQEIISEKRGYNLGQQIQECAIALENEWSAKNIDLSADLADVTYEGNINLMESVWNNLLANAIKFTPKNGEINLSLAETDSEITFSISDTGIGMDGNTLPHIFERYYQGDSSHSSSGNGLGLSIVQRIIKLCGGRITVESRESDGSKFTVTLPKKA